MPDTLNVPNIGDTTKLSLCSDLASNLLDLDRKDIQLVNHLVDSLHQLKHLAADLNVLDLLGQISSGDSRLGRSIESIIRRSALERTVAFAITRTCCVN